MTSNSLVGRLNAYTCVRCGHRIITVDRDDGVTPFMIDCKREGGGTCQNASMQSAFYRVPPEFVPTHEWRKPTTDELAAMPKSWLYHFEQGGLQLYSINETPNSRPESLPGGNRANRRAAASIARREGRTLQ